MRRSGERAARELSAKIPALVSTDARAAERRGCVHYEIPTDAASSMCGDADVRKMRWQRWHKGSLSPSQQLLRFQKYHFTFHALLCARARFLQSTIFLEARLSPFFQSAFSPAFGAASRLLSFFKMRAPFCRQHRPFFIIAISAQRPDFHRRRSPPRF